MVKLRPYQDKIEDEVKVHLRAGEKKILVVAPTGSGKTRIFADIAQKATSKTNRVMILVHRQEIMEQTLEKLYELGVVSGQVASGRPITRDSVQVAMVGTLIRRLSLVRRPDLIISDECFPAGTLIDGTDIACIQKGDTVRSFNHSKNCIEYKKVLDVYSREYEGSLYKITTSNGIEIVCTENHPFFVNGKGYVSAKSFTLHDALLYSDTHEMYKLPNRDYPRPKAPGSRLQILLDKMQIGIQKQNNQATTENLLFSMREGSNIRKKSFAPGSNKTKKCLLFGRMPGESRFRKIIENHAQNKPSEKGNIIVKDERKKPDGNAWNKRENAGKNEGKKVQGARRKWEINSATNIRSFRDRVANGICRKYERCKALFQKHTFSIQTGSWKQHPENRNRDRWEWTFAANNERKGCEKGGRIEFSRVESIEIYKPGSRSKPEWMPRENKVYNFHVEGNENYFANGILVHNCHHSISPTWHKIFDFWSDVPRLGFTATPERLDGRGLGEMFNVMVQGPTIADLVADNYLARPVLFRPPHEIDAKYHVKRGDFSQDEQEKTMSRRAIVGDVIDHYRKHLDHLPVVCFCVSVRHSHLMAEQFIQAGYKAAVVEGGLPKTERKAALQGLADGSLDVVCSCDVISEGVDVPVMAGAILLRRTASLALYLQQAGRALRLSPGKDDAIILDHAGNYHLHGHVLEEREWSLEAKSRKDRGEKPPSITTCPICYGVWPGGVQVCPACGFEFKEREPDAGRARPLRVIEGELIEAGVGASEARDLAALYVRAMGADAKTRQKMLLGAAMRATDKRAVKSLARAVGYKDGWSEWAWSWRERRTAGAR